MKQNNSKSLIGWLIFGILASFIFAFVYTNYRINKITSNGSLKSDSSLYAKVISTKEIRAGYYNGAPYFIKNPNNDSISGIFAEVLDSVGVNLGIKIKWVGEADFPTMATDLESGKFDIIGSGIWISSERGKVADFSIPVLYDVVGAYVRANDKRFDNNLSLINDPKIKISTIDGEMASVIAKKDFPKAEVFSLPQSSDFTLMLKNVVDKKADVTFLGLGPANTFISKNPGSLKPISINSPVRVFPTAIMIKRNEYEFSRMLNLALMDLINNGVVDKIIAKYESFPLSHYRVARPFRTTIN